jgi:urocanate hydratase
VAVKGTVEEGIEELFCEGRAPFVLDLLSRGI